MSASGEEFRWENDTDHRSSFLPDYFTYLSLGFKFIATMTILLMAGLVIATIKITRSLHKPHIIFIANVMITDVVAAVTLFLLNFVMISGFALGQGDLISCNIYIFLLHPVIVYHLTFLMMSVDKVIAIKIPFKHDGIMTHCTVVSIIISLWLFACFISLHILFKDDSYIIVSRYGLCLLEKDAFLGVLLTFAIPVFTESIGTISFNTYLAVKAYQMQQKIQRETRLSGANNQLEHLKQKRGNIKKHMKPIITLLVITLANSTICVLFLVLYIPGKFWISSEAYQKTMDYIIAPNVLYIALILHPFVYGLYFKQIRDPLLRMVKGFILAHSNMTTVTTLQSQIRRTTRM